MFSRPDQAAQRRTSRWSAIRFQYRKLSLFAEPPRRLRKMKSLDFGDKHLS